MSTELRQWLKSGSELMSALAKADVNVYAHCYRLPCIAFPYGFRAADLPLKFMLRTIIIRTGMSSNRLTNPRS